MINENSGQDQKCSDNTVWKKKCDRNGKENNKYKESNDTEKLKQENGRHLFKKKK